MGAGYFQWQAGSSPVGTLPLVLCPAIFLELGRRRVALYGELNVGTADALTLSIRKMLNIILYHPDLTLSSGRAALSEMVKIQHVDGSSCTG